jgi:UDP-N-acetylglucosamine--N-acetylmuramyl-(pentapeptide) pyrophosphoryl-undecaprenol N-acetylglucosamine transferase
MIALPVVLAGYWLGIERELFELNAVPGKAIALLSRWATRVMVCFPQAAHAFTQVPVSVVPYPIRFTSTKNTPTSHAHSPCAQKKTILILGGSQGSLWLNNAIRSWIKQTKIKSEIACIHQCGTDVASLQALYHAYGIPAHVFTYEDNLLPYYQAADLIVCRAGAGTLFEAVHFKKKIIVVPLETDYTDHQKDNAVALAHMYPTLITILRQKECMAQATLFGRTLEQLLAKLSARCAQSPESHKNGNCVRIS